MLIRKIGQNGKTDVILGKALRVLPKTNFLKPLRNLLHRGPSRSRGAFNSHIDFAAERHKINRLGE